MGGMINFEFKKNHIKVNIDANDETEVVAKFINKVLSFLNINSIKLLNSNNSGSRDE
jgi:hypothetical protein